MIQHVMVQLRFLTSDYLDYRISSIKIPSKRFNKAKREAEKELKFRPTLNTVSQDLASVSYD